MCFLLRQSKNVLAGLANFQRLGGLLNAKAFFFDLPQAVVNAVKFAADVAHAAVRGIGNFRAQRGINGLAAGPRPSGNARVGIVDEHVLHAIAPLRQSLGMGAKIFHFPPQEKIFLFRSNGGGVYCGDSFLMSLLFGRPFRLRFFPKIAGSPKRLLTIQFAGRRRGDRKGRND